MASIDVFMRITEYLSSRMMSRGGGPREPVLDDVSPDVFEREYFRDGIEYLSDKPFSVIELRAGGGEWRRYIPIGIDSSTRYISTPFIDLAIVTASIYSRFLGELYDLPPLTGGYPLSVETPPYIALIGAEDLDVSELREKVITRSPAGVPYDSAYNRFVLLDEMRTSTETFLLENLVDKAPSLINGDFYVVMDGPVYHTPLLFRQHYEITKGTAAPRGRLQAYVESWRNMLSERLRVLRKALSGNIIVIGVVKRIEKSSLISSSPSYHAVLAEHGLQVPATDNDQAFIELLYREAIRRGLLGYPLRPFYIGPFRVEPSASLLNRYIGNAVPKIAYYYVFPLYRYAVHMYRVFRLEMIAGSEEIMKCEPHEIILSDTLGAGSALPLSILYADKRAKALSRNITYIMTRYLEIEGMPLTYDALREYEGIGIGHHS